MIRNPDGSVAYRDGIRDFNLEAHQRTEQRRAEVEGGIANSGGSPTPGPQVGPALPAFSPSAPSYLEPEPVDPAHPDSTYDNPAMPPGWGSQPSTNLDLAQPAATADPPASLDLANRDKPPNLRSAAPGGAQSCGNCRHFSAGKCAIHSNYPVGADQVSDDFAPKRTSTRTQQAAGGDLGQDDSEMMLLLEKGGHNLKCPKCGTVNKASSSKCSNCGHDLTEARKAKFANLNASHGASVYQPELMLAGIKESNGLIYKVVCKTGTLALSPGPGQMDVEKPLELTHDLFGLVKSAWDDKAVRYVTVPETHENGTMENTGYVQDLQLLDQQAVKDFFGEQAYEVIKDDDPDTQYMAAGLNITEPEVKSKTLNGSIADMSVGIKFNGRPNKLTGKVYPAYLEHVAWTNQPWVDGLIPFNPAILSQVAPNTEPYDQATDEGAPPWDGVFMTAETSTTPSSGPAAVDAPSDGDDLKALAERLGLTEDEAREWGLSAEDGGRTSQDTLAADQQTASLPSTMPRETTEQKKAREARERAAAAGGSDLAQILADQTARLEAAEARAERAENEATEAKTLLVSQGKSIHLSGIKEKIRNLQLSGLPPTVCLAAKLVYEQDNDLDREDDGSLTLSQDIPDPEKEGETKTVEVKLSSPSQIVDFVLASIPRGERPDLEVVGDLNELHAAQGDSQKDKEAKQKADMDEWEKENHPERFNEDGTRKGAAGGTA